MKPFVAADGSAHSVSDACNVQEATTRKNLHATLRVLAGRDLRSLYDDPVPLDMVKITDWHPDTCDCVLQYIWRKDHDEQVRQHHPHRALNTCHHHQKQEDPAGKHAAVLAENQNKNALVQRAAESLGVELHEIEWSFDNQRRLHLSHPAHGIIDQARLKPN